MLALQVGEIAGVGFECSMLQEVVRPEERTRVINLGLFVFFTNPILQLFRRRNHAPF